MRRYKIIARILLILPIINFVFAVPIAVQDTRQLCGDVVPDIGITMSAKRAVETEKQSDGYSESLSANPQPSAVTHPSSGSTQAESDHGPMNGHALPQNPTLSNAPDYGLMDHPLMGTSEIKQPEVSELVKSPPLNSPESPASFASANEDGYLGSSESSVDEDGYQGSSEPPSSVDLNDHPVSSFQIEKPKPEPESFLSKVFRKVKFWRRISGPGPVRNVVNPAKRKLQDLVDTGAAMVRDIGKSLNVRQTPVIRSVRGSTGKAL